jgi:hypothetical protein
MSATINSIPASQIVNVTPNVLSGGGSQLTLNGLFLTENTRVPLGAVPGFADADAVADYFGPTSVEYAKALVYFSGFTNSNKRPGNLLFAQFNQAAVGAYLRGGDISSLTVAEIQALAGSELTVTVNGTTTTTAGIDFTDSTSLSSMAQFISTALGLLGPVQAVVTGTQGASFTGSLAGTVLTVTAVAYGVVGPGVITGVGVTANTRITSQLTGTTGGIGTYAVSISQTLSSVAMTVAGNILKVTAITSGTLAVGQAIDGTSIPANTFIASQASGTAGGIGNYIVGSNAAAASTTLTASIPVVTYDSITGGLVVISDTTGPASTITFASNTAAAALGLTEATGAVLSQGAAANTPAGMMNAVANTTQNWALFGNVTDPDASGFSVKLAFSAWTNGRNKRFAYVPVDDNDAAPTVTVPATSSYGYALVAAGYDGTILDWQPAASAPLYHDAMIMGWAASVDFAETNGRATLAFKGLSGLTPAVTDLQKAQNLIANGYNYYGASATANDRFQFMYPGSISGSFKWADSFINQIWLNNALQLALMVLLTGTKSIPYNQDGYGLIRAACMDPITAGLNNGVIRAGVPLSELQAQQVNNAAGVKISSTLSTVGWVLQIKDATAQVRAARESPPSTLWYTDGQSVQKIDLTSINVQ